MAEYLIAFALIAAAAGVAGYLHLKAKRARQDEEMRRKGFEREARLLERRKKPR